MLNQMIDRSAFVNSCVSALTETAQKEFAAITNVSVSSLIVYTKPVELAGFGFITLKNNIDKSANVSITEVLIEPTKEELISKIQGMKDYTTEVREAQISSIRDAVLIQYPMRTGEVITRYLSLGTSDPMETFSEIVLECINKMNQYFEMVGYDQSTILLGVDRVDDMIHDGNDYQFLNSEIKLHLTNFRLLMDPQGTYTYDYDFGIGLNLTAIRNSKNDAMFHAIKL